MKCSLCNSDGVNKNTCPYNKDIPIYKYNYKKHNVKPHLYTDEELINFLPNNYFKNLYINSKIYDYDINYILDNLKNYKNSTIQFIVNNYLEYIKQNKKINKNKIIDFIFNGLIKSKTKSKYNITESKYKQLIFDKRNNKINIENEVLLKDTLNQKLCNCIKKISLKNLNDVASGDKYINPYGICINSIYKNRNIEYKNEYLKNCF